MLNDVIHARIRNRISPQRQLAQTLQTFANQQRNRVRVVLRTAKRELLQGGTFPEQRFEHFQGHVGVLIDLQGANVSQRFDVRGLEVQRTTVQDDAAKQRRKVEKRPETVYVNVPQVEFRQARAAPLVEMDILKDFSVQLKVLQVRHKFQKVSREGISDV
uniref:(northern house mosquito) hypothetical protein n=1 Tax=Culex pipiens TaxID=7175 RepID=A0A8D8CJ09_CULPI